MRCVLSQQTNYFCDILGLGNLLHSVAGFHEFGCLRIIAQPGGVNIGIDHAGRHKVHRNPLRAKLNGHIPHQVFQCDFTHTVARHGRERVASQNRPGENITPARCAHKRHQPGSKFVGGNRIDLQQIAQSLSIELLEGSLRANTCVEHSNVEGIPTQRILHVNQEVRNGLRV